MVMFRKSRILLAPVAGAVLAAVFSCQPLGNPYKSYLGENLIADTSMGDLSSSRWTRQPGGSYILVSPVSLSDPSLLSGLPGATAVYRIEIPNLLINGNFENDTAIVSDWIVSDTSATAESFTSQAGIPALSGKSLHVKIDKNQSRVDLDLYTALSVPPVTNGMYVFRYDYRTAASLLCQVRSENAITAVDAQSWKLGGGINGSETDPLITNLNSFAEATQSGESLQEFPELMNPRYFSFGTYYDGDSFIGDDTQKGISLDIYVDNFRILRSDIRPGLALTLTGEDGTLPLVSGTYRLSIYVRRDGQKEAAAGIEGMFYPAESFTLEVSSTAAVDLRMLDDFSPVFQAAAEWDETWTELAVEFKVQFPENAASNEKTLTFTLSPVSAEGYPQDLDAVSILASAPRLELLP